MYLRQSTGQTLDTLSDTLEVPGLETLHVASTEIKVDVKGADSDEIKIGKRSLPATSKNLLALGDWLGVPQPFLKKVNKQVGKDLAGTILTTMLERTSGSSAAVSLTDTDIRTVRDPGKLAFEPFQLVSVARKVLGTGESPVERLVNEPGTFSFDVRVPEDFDRGVGGDPDVTLDHPVRGKQVGDITAGGLRFDLDLKRNLAPTVQPWSYRLFCTNGCGTVEEGFKIDARGQSVDEVLAELERVAESAFSAVERQIVHFYSLRQQTVENPERWLRRVAVERGIPDRSLVRMLDEIASADWPDDPTEFDLVNLITNQANNPAVRNDGGRLLLENAGGSIVSDASTRCGHCNSRLTPTRH